MSEFASYFKQNCSPCDFARSAKVFEAAKVTDLMI